MSFPKKKNLKHKTAPTKLELELWRLQEQGLKAKFDKCAFFQKEVPYLGHEVSVRGGIYQPKQGRSSH